MSNAEEGIARAQIEAARARSGDARVVDEAQRSGIAYIDERIFIYVGAMLFLGLCVVWATAKTAWVLYGSLGIAIGFALMWGYARIQRLERIRRERAAQARASSTPPTSD